MRDAFVADSPNVSPADHFTYHQEHKPPWGESSFAQLSFYKNLLPFDFRLLLVNPDTSFSSNGTTSSGFATTAGCQLQNLWLKDVKKL